MNEKKKNAKYGARGYFFILAGLIITVLYGIILIMTKGVIINLSLPLDVDIMASVGNFLAGIVGPLWALAGVMFFIDSLEMQREELRLQREDYKLQTEALNNQVKELAETKKQYEGQRKSLEERNNEDFFFKLLNNKIIEKVSQSGYLHTRDVIVQIFDQIDNDVADTISYLGTFKHGIPSTRKPARFIPEEVLNGKSLCLAKINNDELKKRILDCYNSLIVNSDTRYALSFLRILIEVINRIEIHKREQYYEIVKGKVLFPGCCILIFILVLDSVIAEKNIALPFSLLEIQTLKGEEKAYNAEHWGKLMEQYL